MNLLTDHLVLSTQPLLVVARYACRTAAGSALLDQSALLQPLQAAQPTCLAAAALVLPQLAELTDAPEETDLGASSSFEQLACDMLQACHLALATASQQLAQQLPAAPDGGQAGPDVAAALRGMAACLSTSQAVGAAGSSAVEAVLSAVTDLQEQVLTLSCLHIAGCSEVCCCSKLPSAILSCAGVQVLVPWLHAQVQGVPASLSGAATAAADLLASLASSCPDQMMLSPDLSQALAFSLHPMLQLAVRCPGKAKAWRSDGDHYHPHPE